MNVSSAGARGVAPGARERMKGERRAHTNCPHHPATSAASHAPPQARAPRTPSARAAPRPASTRGTSALAAPLSAPGPRTSEERRGTHGDVLRAAYTRSERVRRLLLWCVCIGRREGGAPVGDEYDARGDERGVYVDAHSAVAMGSTGHQRQVYKDKIDVGVGRRALRTSSTKHRAEARPKVAIRGWIQGAWRISAISVRKMHIGRFDATPAVRTQPALPQKESRLSQIFERHTVNLSTHPDPHHRKCTNHTDTKLA